MYHEAEHRFAEHGIGIEGLKIDVPAMMKQKVCVLWSVGCRSYECSQR